MLTAHHISKTYGIHTILEDVSLTINPDDRLGLIGPNGCGKTTLLRILAKIEAPDKGRVVHTRPGLRVGYLPQGLESDLRQTISSILSPSDASTDELEAKLARLAAALADDPENVSLQESYDASLQRLSAVNRLPSAALGPLGLAEVAPETLVSQLSGGQKTRLMLARLLLEPPHLLLLDEPTNHLDVQILKWLEDWLASFSGAALIISHDRAFLDNTVQAILDLDPETHTLRAYPGNYSEYLTQFLHQRQKQWEAYHDQVAEIRRMKQDIARTKQQALQVEQSTTSRQPFVRRIAKKVAVKAKSREKKLKRYLASEERVERPKPSWQLKLEFEAPDTASKDVLVTNDLAVGYPGQAPLFSGLDFYIRAGQRIALTGPNGCGKTTLLRTIAGRLEPLSGDMRLGASIRLGYMSQEQESLDPQRSALEIIQRLAPFNETEARHFLHFFLFSDDDPLRPSRELSYGERARLQLALLVAQGCNFLLLDEPINHLDIPSRERFEQALANLEGTVLAVVHDRYFIERFATDFWLAENGNIKQT
jgi:ATP-binding cassette subfamily F protein 3